MITVCILTKNAQETINATLESVRLFSEVLILDNGSTDATLEIAKQYSNVKTYETKFCGFGPLRNQIAAMARNDWILALDSDEVLSESLIHEILHIQLNQSLAYAIPRHNFYQGKRIRGCGWSPDYVARLYHRKQTRYFDLEVHESLETKNVQKLTAPLFHTPYRTTFDFLAKMQHYSTLFAQQYQGKKSSSFQKAILHAAFTFFRSYILKRGFLDGSEGFVISLYNANSTFYKYMKLKELNGLLKAPVQQSPHSEQEKQKTPSPSR
ncbi:MAG TPA: glycosyltransferase family 2 protein [Chlamydiales bacterium]|nr:glycosyltransferase family 2 protein [Chlamydiales bacterium]